MEHDLNTTQRLVADHRIALESAARRDRLVKGGDTTLRRQRRWPLTRRPTAALSSIAIGEHCAVA